VTVAYVVLSHRNPDQVLRLVRALGEGPAARVLVRHDQRHSRLELSALRAAGGEPIEDRIEVEWATWSYVELIVACLREAVARHDPDWALILSGQDYPLRPLAAVEAELEAGTSDGRIGAVREVELRRPPHDDEFFLRCHYRHYARPRAWPPLPHALRPFVYTRDLPPLVGVRRLRRPPLRPYASADWLTLARPAVASILAAAADGGLTDYFRRVAVPSESFFASVLLNDPSLTIERDHRRYIRFPSPGAPHPATLTRDDLEALAASGADFARKFDATLYPDVLDALDARRRELSGRRALD
jgi:hypothetical protein